MGKVKELWSQAIWERITKNLNDLVNLQVARGKTKTSISCEIGVKLPTLCHYLSGKIFPAYDTLIKLCLALDCTYEDILGSLDYPRTWQK